MIYVLNFSRSKALLFLFFNFNPLNPINSCMRSNLHVGPILKYKMMSVSWDGVSATLGVGVGGLVVNIKT